MFTNIPSHILLFVLPVSSLPWSVPKLTALCEHPPLLFEHVCVLERERGKESQCVSVGVCLGVHVHVRLSDSQTISMEYKWLSVWTCRDSPGDGYQDVALNQQPIGIIKPGSLQRKLNPDIRLANVIVSAKRRCKRPGYRRSILFSSFAFVQVERAENCLSMQICNWPPDPADELRSSIHWKQHQISKLCSPSTRINPLLGPCLQVKRIVIQNQSQGVTCASAQPFLYLQGNNMHRLRIKKCNDKSEFSWWTEALLTSRGHGMNWGRADLQGSWQWGGHIQSHLTHSALTPNPWQRCPRVNSHLRGSIALEPLPRAFGQSTGGNGGRWKWYCSLAEAADLKRAGPLDHRWCGRFILKLDVMRGKGTLDRKWVFKFRKHQSKSF